MPASTSSLSPTAPAAAAAQPAAAQPADAETAARLRILIARLSRRLKPTEAAGELTTSEVDVLGIMARERQAPVKLSELAVLAGLNPTMLSRMVAKLEAQGWLERLADVSDGRVSRVELTPAGRRLHEKVRKERSRRLAYELDLMPEADRVAIEAALPALERLAERLMER
jgi:DNA-binding MarR family transcriptional regulator